MNKDMNKDMNICQRPECQTSAGCAHRGSSTLVICYFAAQDRIAELEAALRDLYAECTEAGHGTLERVEALLQKSNESR